MVHQNNQGLSNYLNPLHFVFFFIAVKLINRGFPPFVLDNGLTFNALIGYTFSAILYWTKEATKGRIQEDGSLKQCLDLNHNKININN